MSKFKIAVVLVALILTTGCSSTGNMAFGRNDPAMQNTMGLVASGVPYGKAYQMTHNPNYKEPAYQAPAPTMCHSNIQPGGFVTTHCF